MESYNQSFNGSVPSSDMLEIPLFATYLNMVIILMVVLIVITPAMMVIWVICTTKELHTKYYFFVANLLVTNIIHITVESVVQYVIMILYLCGLDSDSTGIILKRFIIPLRTILRFMTILLLITLAIDRVVVIASPYRHRYIMTKRTVAGLLAAVWGSSAILTVTVTIVVPVDIAWPLAVIDYQYTILPFYLLARLTSAIFIIVANVYLFYQVTKSNRKLKQNERLGCEEEAKGFTKLVQLFRSQSKTTTALLVVGGIDVVANIFIPIVYVAFSFSADGTTNIYLHQFLMYPIESSLLLSHSLTYGIYMKKIRRRLPRFNICQTLCPNHHSQVVAY